MWIILSGLLGGHSERRDQIVRSIQVIENPRSNIVHCCNILSQITNIFDVDNKMYNMRCKETLYKA